MDTDELRYIARMSNLSYESCQTCEDAAELIDELRAKVRELEQERERTISHSQ